MFNLSKKESVHLLVFIILSLTAIKITAQPIESVVLKNQTLREKKRNVRPNADDKREAHLRAVEQYKQEILKSPRNALLYNNLGTTYVGLENYEEAVKSLKKALEIEPDLANIHYNLSVIYDRQERLPEALAAAQKAVSLDGKNVNYRVVKCQVLLALEDFKKAVPCLEILFKMRPPDAREKTNYGLALMYTEQRDKAFTVLKETVVLFPKEAITHNALGMFLFLKKKYKDSLLYFARAVELDGKFAPARYNLAIAQLTTNDRNSALKHYAFLKKSDSDYAAQLYKYLFNGRVVQANKKEKL